MFTRKKCLFFAGIFVTLEMESVILVQILYKAVLVPLYANAVWNGENHSVFWPVMGK